MYVGAYRLQTGRDVFLKRFTIEGTYAGVLEGSPKTVNQYLRRNLKKRAVEMLRPGHPLTIVEPPEGELPRWTCAAEFESGSGVRTSDPDFNSRLYVCWLMEDTARSMDETFALILSQVNWEESAEDFDVTNF